MSLEWMNASISQGFGPTDEPLDGPYAGYAHFNKGIDYEVSVGTPIGSPVSGTVISARDSGDGWGYSVKVRAADGTIHNFGHLSSISVSEGDPISRGTVVGKSGGAKGSPGAGSSTGPHLSYDVWQADGTFIDPSGYLGGSDMSAPSVQVDDGPHSAPQPGSEGTGNFKPDQDPRQLTADAIQKKANLQAQLANYLASNPGLYQSNGRWGSDKSEPVISERTGKVISQGDPVFTVDDYATGLMRQISAIDSTITTIGELSKAKYFTTGGAAGEEYITVNPDPAALLDSKQRKQWEDYVGRITDIEDLVAKERSFDIAGDRANAQTAQDMQDGLIGPGWGTFYTPRPGRADFNPQTASRFSSDSADLLDLQGYGEVGAGQLAPEEVNEYDMLMGRTRVPAFAFGTAPRPGMEGIDPRLLALVGKPSVPMPKPQIRGIPDNGRTRAPAPGGF